MIDKFIQRENLIFEVIQRFLDEKLDFVIIGGYAVSAHKHRFSVDADLVLQKKDAHLFEAILVKNKFEKTISKELDNAYSTVFVRFERKTELPVSFDLLLDGMGARQTGASYGFEFIRTYSSERKIIGIQKEVMALVPCRELLIALKLHAGRLTDLRDIVALCKNIDIKLVKELVTRGDCDIVKQHIHELLKATQQQGFVDSFKGVFIEKEYDIDWDTVQKLKMIVD